MYKKALHRIEDAFIPAMLRTLMLQHLEQLPNREPTCYDKALELLTPDIIDQVGHDGKLLKRLSALENRVANWFVDNKCEIRKAYMILSRLAVFLAERQAVSLASGTIEVVQDIDDIINTNMDDDIMSIDISAYKQMPKLLRFLQGEGYYV